jgi:hypothetical protein
VAKKRKVKSYCSLGSYFQQCPAIATRLAIRTVSHPDRDINLARKVNYFILRRKCSPSGRNKNTWPCCTLTAVRNNTTICNTVGFLIFSNIDVWSKHIVDRRNKEQQHRNAWKLNNSVLRAEKVADVWEHAKIAYGNCV